MVNEHSQDPKKAHKQKYAYAYVLLGSLTLWCAGLYSLANAIDSYRQDDTEAHQDMCGGYPDKYHINEA